MQAVCKHDLLFTSIYVGWPGRVHVANVLRHSNLPETGDEKYQFGNFPILEELRYNEILSSKGQIIERVFGLLKGRSRRLKHIDMRNVLEMCGLIMATCILHNVCILSEEECQDFLKADNEQIQNQQAQFNNVPQNNIPARQKKKTADQTTVNELC